MRGLTTTSLLAFILALFSTVAIAAPGAPVSKAAVNVLNVESASCMKDGSCNFLSPPGTCCGTCILIDAEQGFCYDDSASAGCKLSGPCSIFSPPNTCCEACNLIDSESGYCLPPRPPPSQR